MDGAPMSHTPVLLSECIDGLKVRPDGKFIDATLGRGGHAAEIAARLTDGRLLAIDRDERAITEAGTRLSAYKDRVTLVQGNFKDLDSIMDANGFDVADGMLFDLGVSSPQLDDAERGFSYMHDAPLDMRMNRQDTLTAYDIVNDWAEEELRRIFFEYGEERYSRQIARAIARKRAAAKIVTTFDINEIIYSAIPSASRRGAGHPSKRCFQALRIAVNDELGAIASMLKTAPDRLKVGGRICLICFHSLESKLVKNAFASRSNGCTCPKELPLCVCGFVPTLKVITRSAIRPSAEEVKNNPRAKSAALRIAERK